MKKKIFFLISVLMLLGLSAFSQQAIWNRTNIVSPLINSDKSETFSLFVPYSDEVRLTGDWLRSEGRMPASVIMVKSEKGVWQHTTELLLSNLYGCFFC